MVRITPEHKGKEFGRYTIQFIVVNFKQKERGLLMANKKENEAIKKVMDQIDDILFDNNMYIVADTDGEESWLLVGIHETTEMMSTEQLG